MLLLLLAALITRHWFPLLVLGVVVLTTFFSRSARVSAPRKQSSGETEGQRHAREAAAAAQDRRDWRAAQAKAQAEAFGAGAEAAEARAARARAEGSRQRTDTRWTSNDPHVVLGIPRSADQATIRSAFMTLSKQYHPDRVASLGPEFRELAEDRMKTINAAYAAIRRI